MTKRSVWAVIGALLFTSIAMVMPASAAVLTLVDGTHVLKFNRTSQYVAKVGSGTAVNDVVLYKNVVTVGGQAVDAVVTTLALSGSISNYDNPGSASTAAGYADFFQLNTVGGRATLRFDFYEGGTWSGANTGVPVILQNVKIKSIDLDSSGTNGYQYSDFSGFQKYTLTTDTNLGVQSVAGSNLVRFIATKTGARSAVPQDQVLIKYDALSTMTVSFGNVVAGQTNFYGLTFGPWNEGGTTQEYSNGFNAAPTSTDYTQLVESGTATVIPKSSFGTYQDADSNPFMQVKITQLESGGDLEVFVGGTWADVTLGQVISVADIERGYLRFTGAQTDTIKFLVQDGLDYSASDYTLTLSVVADGQYIDFANPGAQVVNSSFPSGAVSKQRVSNTPTALPVTLTSQTIGVCTTSNDTITAVAVGTCVIVATQPGGGSYGAALPVTQSFPITATQLTAQTITFASISNTTTGTPSITVSPTASSSLPVALASLTPNVCTVSGFIITVVGPGTCTIRATQPGNGTFAPAVPVEVSFLIAAGAPAATTSAATGVSSTSATLNGSINGYGNSTVVTFCVSSAATVNSGALTCDVSTETATQSPVQLSGTKAVSKLKSSLTANSTYYYQVIANNGQITYGNVVSFKASDPGATGAVTRPVTAQSSASGSNYDVTLPGTVTASGTWSATFCYKKSSGAPSTSNGRISGCTVTSASPASLTNPSAAAVSKVVRLGDSDVVWYQVVATDNTDTSTGRVLRFAVRGPYARTDAATSVTGTAARINGMVDRQGRDLSSVKFCVTATKPANIETNPILSCNWTYDARGWSKSTTGNQSVDYDLSELLEGTTYFFQVIAKTSRGTNYGQILEFTTTKPAPAPLVKTEPATAVNATSATLNGAVNPRDFDATATFCYGTQANLSSCTSVTANPAATSGNVYVPVSVELLNLSTLTTYYFRALGTNVNGTDTGTVLTFTTGAPIALTSAATNVDTASATLNGAARAQGDTATATFCWGTANTVTDGVLGACATAAATPGSVSGTTLTPLTVNLTNLSLGQTYYFQSVADKNGLRAYGDVKSFVVAAAPEAVTDTATAGPALNGRVTSNGDVTNVYFCYGQNSATRDGLLLGCTLVRADTPTATANATMLARTLDLSGVQLASGATYYFQVIAENSRGTTYGSVRSFAAPSTGPTAETGDAELANSSVTLSGSANANGLGSTVKFCYRSSYSVDSTTIPGVDVLVGCTGTTATAPAVMANASRPTISGTLDTDETLTVTGLTPGTTYYYQLKAWTTATPSQVAYGAIRSFVYGAPSAVTRLATSITATGAVLNGTVGGDTITATSFCIGTTPTSDPLTGAMDACFGAADTVTAVSASGITGDVSETETALTSGTTYYFQVLAENAQGTTYGAVLSFTAGLATVITDPVSGLTSTTATLNGLVNANGASDLPMTYRLSYVNSVSADGLLDDPLVDLDTEPASGTAALSRPLAIQELLASTKYFYQLVGDLTGTPVVGDVEYFITDPAVVTDTPSVGSADVWFYGNATEDLTDVMFCWATADNARTNFDPATCTAVSAAGSSNQYSANVTGLTPGTNYQVQIFGQRGGTWFRGLLVSFTTSGGNSSATPRASVPTPSVKRLVNPTRSLPKKGTRTDASVETTERKSKEAKLQPVVQKVVNASASSGISNPAVTLNNVTVLPEIKQQVAKQIKLEETKDGVKVTPVDGFTGRLVVPVITVANNEEVEVLTEVVVNPEPVPTGQATPESIKKSTVTWAPSTSQVVEYVVEINGKEACKTTGTSCDVSAVVGPKTKVEVTAIGNDQTESEVTAAQYKALQLIAAAKVQFAESSAKLRPAAKKVLQNVAKIIVEAGFTQIAIEGHTDSQGGQKNASPLSKARAVATQKYLDSLLPERLTVKLKASGLSKPVASNDTKAGQAQNRRAEVLVK